MASTQRTRSATRHSRISSTRFCFIHLSLALYCRHSIPINTDLPSPGRNCRESRPPASATTPVVAAYFRSVRFRPSTKKDIPVLSEESADLPFDTRQKWRYYWLVGPLCAPREFSMRHG